MKYPSLFFRREVLCAALSCGLCVARAQPVPAVRGSFFSPSAFPSLGSVSVAANQKVEFDTGSTNRPPAVSGAISGNGQLGRSQSGSVEVAVFAFDALTLGQGAEITVTGDRALVLLSKGPLAVDTTLDLSGQVGKPLNRAEGRTSGGKGGPGGEGGEYQKTLSSAPPGAAGGDGGPAMKDSGRPGIGFGAGFNRRVKGGVAGGGGAYGGTGGETSQGSAPMGPVGPSPMPGGIVYGDPALEDLFGGSGGAGGSNDRAFDSAGGGGGGGALALVSLQGIHLGENARLLANGGAGGKRKICGGGGSGGAILLAAPELRVLGGTRVEAKGGDGGDGGPEVETEIASGNHRRNFGSGGGGGGGRIALYIPADFGEPGKGKVERQIPAFIHLQGGKGGTAAKNGEAGTLYDGAWPNLR